MSIAPAAWVNIRNTLSVAKGIAWDQCHKIYILMDDQKMEQMRGYGYDPLLDITDPSEAFETIKDWWNESCGLRFISAVRTVDGDPNDGFTDLIAQFEDESENA